MEVISLLSVAIYFEKICAFVNNRREGDKMVGEKRNNKTNLSSFNTVFLYAVQQPEPIVMQKPRIFIYSSHAQRWTLIK